MPRIETNDFAITNIELLRSKYKLYRIRGLNRKSPEYYANRQHIIRRLSFLLQKPVTIIDREDGPCLVVGDGAKEPASPMMVVRTPVSFEPVDIFELDYTKCTPENNQMRLRFMQFLIQGPLYSHPDLWQPRSGGPFFRKIFQPHSTDEILHHVGFSVRPVIAPDGGLALRIHVANKYVSRNPLPAYISLDEFEYWKGRHLIYHYGYRWYEIKTTGLSDWNAMEHPIPTGGTDWMPLLEFVIQESRKPILQDGRPSKPIPPELAQVPHDGSVLLYLNNRKDERGAPTSLCYRVYGAHDEGMEHLHRKSLIPPEPRRWLTLDFVKRHLHSVRVGGIRLNVETTPISIQPKMFAVPDFKFGHSTVLSERNSPGALHVSLDNLGKTRLALLRDPKVGFYHTEPLDRQYLILPQSVYESYGERFVSDLRDAVDDLYPQEEGYNPEIVTYNDRVKKTFIHQGKAILETVRAKCRKPGYAVVMIHHTIERKIREEDQLAAMVVRELREDPLDLKAAVIHSAVGRECYVLINDKQGRPMYIPRERARKKLTGYLRNIALNKVLLTNQRWPFVLETPLHADITIGIDVKHHTAGIIIVGRNGGKIRSLCKVSKQKEKLRSEQIEAYLKELITEEASASQSLIRIIVIHRDGRVWPEEIEGAHKAMEYLKRMSIIAQDATLTILEIPKSPPAPQRFFDVSEQDSGQNVDNPQIGLYRIVEGIEGYLCTTGRAFPRPGTVDPLHVRYVEGTLPFKEALEDVYCLSALALTKPDDCTRHPITIKLNDRILGDAATEYNAEALELSGAAEDEEEESLI